MQGEECGIWQHCSCVGLQPPRPMPEHFFCESCTCERANPFWRNSSSERRMLLPPALLQPQQLPVSSASHQATTTTTTTTTMMIITITMPLLTCRG